MDTNIPLAIGALDRDGVGITTEFFDGFIDEVVIFDQALTGSQVQQAFDSATIPEPGTVVLIAMASLALLMWKRR